MEVKFLICLPDDPGEILLSTALIRCLKNQVADSMVIPVVRDSYTWLLSGNPFADELLSYRNKPEEILLPVKDQGADYLIDLDGTGRLRRFKKRLKVLDFNLERNGLGDSPERKRMFGKRNPGGSWTERAFKTLSVFDVADDDLGPEYNALPPDPDWMPGDFHNGYLVICLHALEQSGILTESQLTQLAGMIEQPLIITGTQEDREMADHIGIQVGCSVLPACGDFSDPQIASVIKGSEAVLAFNPFWSLMAVVLNKPLAPLSDLDMPRISAWMRQWIKK